MRVVFQRVSQAAVRVEGKVVGEIGAGALLLLGIAPEDGPEELQWMVQKVLGLRVFQDEQGKMNRSLMDIGGALLVVSQFTLYGDCRKGRRPSFIGAAAPEKAEALYEEFMALCRQEGVSVESGVFGAMMDVEIHNQGPVTLLLEREAS